MSEEQKASGEAEQSSQGFVSKSIYSKGEQWLSAVKELGLSSSSHSSKRDTSATHKKDEVIQAAAASLSQGDATSYDASSEQSGEGQAPVQEATRGEENLPGKASVSASIYTTGEQLFSAVKELGRKSSLSSEVQKLTLKTTAYFDKQDDVSLTKQTNELSESANTASQDSGRLEISPETVMSSGENHVEASAATPEQTSDVNAVDSTHGKAYVSDSIYTTGEQLLSAVMELKRVASSGSKAEEQASEATGPASSRTGETTDVASTSEDQEDIIDNVQPTEAARKRSGSSSKSYMGQSIYSTGEHLLSAVKELGAKSGSYLEKRTAHEAGGLEGLEGHSVEADSCTIAAGNDVNATAQASNNEDTIHASLTEHGSPVTEVSPNATVSRSFYNTGEQLLSLARDLSSKPSSYFSKQEGLQGTDATEENRKPGAETKEELGEGLDARAVAADSSVIEAGTEPTVTAPASMAEDANRASHAEHDSPVAEAASNATVGRSIYNTGEQLLSLARGLSTKPTSYFSKQEGLQEADATDEHMKSGEEAKEESMEEADAPSVAADSSVIQTCSEASAKAPASMKETEPHTSATEQGSPVGEASSSAIVGRSIYNTGEQLLSLARELSSKPSNYFSKPEGLHGTDAKGDTVNMAAVSEERGEGAAVSLDHGEGRSGVDVSDMPFAEVAQHTDAKDDSTQRTTSFVKCWRCGEFVMPDIDSIEQHSAICHRPSISDLDVGSNESASNCDPLQLANVTNANEATTDEVELGIEAGESGGASVDGLADATGASGSTNSASSTLQVSLLERFPSTVSAVSNFKKSAYSYFGRDGLKLPDDGLINVQASVSGLWLSCGSLGADEGPRVGLRSDCDGDTDGGAIYSQWMLIKSSKEGIFGIRSVHTGMCLSVDSDDGLKTLVRLTDSSVGVNEEWSIRKTSSRKTFSLQNVHTGLYLRARGCGVIDGADVEASEAEVTKDCEWHISGVTGEGDPSEKASRHASLTPELDPFEVYARIESTLERSILLVLDPVLHGIPKLGIASARVEAKRLVGEHGGAEAAFQALRRKAEEEEGSSAGLSGRLLHKVSQVLVIRFLPFVGGGAYLSYTMYTRLRLAALVAEIFDNDTEDPEVQSMLLFCIAPDGASTVDSTQSQSAEDATMNGSDARAADSGIPSTSQSVINSARSLSHVLARQVVQRATGWKTAADLYDLAAAICSEGYAWSVPDDENAKKVEGSQEATLRRAALLFRPTLAKKIRPVALVLLVIGAILPLLASLIRHTFPLMRWLFSCRIGLTMVIIILSSMIIGFARVKRHLLDCIAERPEIVSSVVLTGHAALPLVASFDATATLVDGLARTPMAASVDEKCGSGLLVVLLGTWLWLRLWQRCRAESGSVGPPTRIQRTLIIAISCIGCIDLFGPHFLGVHSLPHFGALQSHHWLFGIFKAMALECQLLLLTLLRDRSVLLRVLGATRMMSLALALFLGGVTASIGFFVSRGEFTRFVDTLAPPPRVAAAVVALKRRQAFDALALGVFVGGLWQLPTRVELAMLSRCLGFLVGAAVVGMYADTFEEHRETLLEPSGIRWLLLLPETSERARDQASQMWRRVRMEAAQAAVSKGTRVVGQSLISCALDYMSSFWAAAATKPLEATVAAAAEVVEAVEDGI